MILVVLALTGAVHARAHAVDVLTNDDVVKMTRAQVSPGIILATISAANATFDVSPAALIALKEAGVEDRIVEAKHQNTSMVLVSGKGQGPFSGPLGADSVARELVKLLKPYRQSTPAAKGHEPQRR